MSSACVSNWSKHQHGMTFIELAVVLLVIAILSLSVSSAFISTNEAQSRNEALQHASQVQASIRAYALRNGRLPCPAIDKRGYESRVGQACMAGLQLGFVPYVALGLQMPSESVFARYAVFRIPNATDPLLDIDLADARERTGDSAGEPLHMHVTDLIAALLRINSSAAVTTSPYLTGDGDAAGVMDCVANRVSSVAYWLTLPMTDANSDGDRLDGPNTLTGLCASYPSAKTTAQFDDLVISETPLQLAGWLRSSVQQ